MADAPVPVPVATGTPPTGDTTALVRAADLAGVSVGRYILTKSIGRGGMGEVFLARDSRLKREVAIKVVVSDFARDGVDGSSILREARAIARLNHPHIATVYDVLEVDGQAYVVMEYLHGETLAQRLARGPLSVGETAALGCQLAQALAHAHTNGIVHCDLKPANVFLTPEAGLKVVDFGLARSVGGHPSGGTTDGVGASPSLIACRAGTPAYMSPEHRHGLTLDGRSDLYCAGLMLHEMVCGSLPQPGLVLQASTATTTTQPSLTLHPSICPPLRGVIETAVRIKPSDRYQTAEEMERALQPLVSQAPGPTVSPARPARAWLAGTALVLTMIALLVSLAGRSRSSSPAVATPFVVAVMPFTAAATDESAAPLAAGLADIVTNDLTPYAGLVVATVGRDASSKSGDVAILAKELGADALLLGNLRRETGRLAVELRLYRAGLGTFSKDAQVSEADHDLGALQASLRDAVRSLLAEIGVKAPGATTSLQSGGQLLPSTLTAFEDYQQARSFLERGDVPQNVDHALTILKRVVAQEPRYALAHAAIGEASWRKWEITRDAEWSDQAHQSALEALRLAPDQPAVRYAVALIYQGTGRRQEAIDELEQLIRVRPSFDEAYRLLGRLHADNGAFDQSIAALSRATELRPGFWTNYAVLGNVYYRAGRFDDAIHAFERFVELRPDSASAYQRLGTAQHAAGRVDLAVANYQRAVEITPNPNAYSNLGTALYDVRRYGDAVDAYQKAIALDARSPSLRRNLADALRRLERHDEARRTYHQAVDLARAVLVVNPKDASTLSLQAMCLARVGRIDEALAASTTALALAPSDNDILYERSLMLVSANRPTEALDFLGRALEAGYSRNRAQADDDLRPLRQLPGFQEVIAERR